MVSLLGGLTILEEDVEQDDADFVVGADVAIQQNGHDGSHGVLDLLTLGIGAHGQILEHPKGGTQLQEGDLRSVS